MVVRQIPQRKSSSTRLIVIIGLLLLIFGSRWIASLAIEYAWWREMGQLSTWGTMLLYGSFPVLVAALLAFVVLWIAHARALKYAGESLRYYPIYAKLSSVVLFLLAGILALATIDNWTVVRYLGGTRMAADPASWQDPAFGKPLAFYFFQLPFYGDLLRFVLGLAFLTALIYWVVGRGWKLRSQVGNWSEEGIRLEFRDLHFQDAFSSKFFRAVLGIFLLGLAVRYYLDRYSLVLND